MFLPLAAVLAIAILWSIYWFAASSYAHNAFEAERARLSAQGVKLACGGERWAGFPFRFEWDCASMSLHAPSFRGESARLRVVTLAYNPTHVLVFLDGPNSATAAAAPFATTVPGQIVASLEGLAGSEPSFSIDVPAASAGAFGKASRILLHGRIKDGKTELAAEAQGVSASAPGYPQFDGVEVILQASVPGDLAALARLPADLREGRAAITINRLSLEQGTMTATGNGTLGLDVNRRIAGTFSAETNDIDSLLAILAPLFQMKDNDRAMIRSMLADSGTPAPANATFTAKDGALYWGVIPIGLLEPVY